MTHGLDCPSCHAQTEVKDSRASGAGIRRRRHCTVCPERFTTLEMVAGDMPGARFQEDGRISPEAHLRAKEIADILASLSTDDGVMLVEIARRFRASAGVPTVDEVSAYSRSFGSAA